MLVSRHSSDCNLVKSDLVFGILLAIVLFKLFKFEGVRRTVLGRGAMCRIVLDASQVFVHCSFRNAPVDALVDIFGRDVVS